MSILPPQLCTSPGSIDVALTYGTVTLGMLNATTHRLEVYNRVPSKSLGLEYKTHIKDGSNEDALGEGTLVNISTLSGTCLIFVCH